MRKARASNEVLCTRAPFKAECKPALLATMPDCWPPLEDERQSMNDDGERLCSSLKPMQLHDGAWWGSK